MNVSGAKYTDEELENIQPYLGYRPLEIIRKTLENTTQLARTIWKFPLRRHLKARFPFLNRIRLEETVSNDTVPSSVKSINSRSYMQVFYGCTSHMINIYGMKAKSEFPDAYTDFIREEGIPSCLRRDLAAEEKSEKIDAINRKYLVKDGFSEAHNQQQNPIELHAVRWLKQNFEILLDRCGAPPEAWLEACIYLAKIHNLCADETLKWRTPFAVRKGYTPDISAYLHFRFWQKVYFLDHEESFPSSNERVGYWCNVSDTVGDHLTYVIYNPETGHLIERSVVRPADDPTTPNCRVVHPSEVHPDESTETETPDSGEATLPDSGETQYPWRKKH